MSTLQDKDSRTNGRWTKAEHQKFMLGLQLYGKNWKKIEELVGTRTGSQIRSHAQKYFLKAKRPADLLDGSEAGQESHVCQDQMTVNSNSSCEYEENQNQYSYFLNRIIKASVDHHISNFWSEFIDIASAKAEAEDQIRRKDSFVTFQTCNDSKQETALSQALILGEPLI